jgi:glycosyltransferase involved in cell wall biosynthesis
MSNNPLVSICIPTYNQTIHLLKLINSILNQKLITYEIIISDDSSNNEVSNLIHEFNSNGTQIQYYKNTPSMGAPKNWNYAISLAKGDYIKIMHHDQWFEDDLALYKLYDKIKDDKNKFVFCAVRNNFRGIISELILTEEQFNNFNNEPEQLILANLIGGPSAILYHKDIKIKYDEKIIWLVDIDFYLQLYKNGYKAEYINEVLYTSMTDFDSLTNDNLVNSEKQLYEYSYLFNKYIKKLPIKKRIIYLFEIFKILKIVINKNSYITQFFRLLKRII